MGNYLANSRQWRAKYRANSFFLLQIWHKFLFWKGTNGKINFTDVKKVIRFRGMTVLIQANDALWEGNKKKFEFSLISLGRGRRNFALASCRAFCVCDAIQNCRTFYGNSSVLIYTRWIKRYNIRISITCNRLLSFYCSKHEYCTAYPNKTK